MSPWRWSAASEPFTPPICRPLGREGIRRDVQLLSLVSDCPLTYDGFTVYGTVDVGYGYDTAGIAFGKWYDKGVTIRPDD